MTSFSVARARPGTPNLERFERRISPGENGCWIWIGGADRYGKINLIERKTVPAHRWSYEFHIAPIPAGLQIDHLCRNTRCVNPWHLEPVTDAVNHTRWGESITECKHGHAYTPENTGRRGKAKFCKTCARERSRVFELTRPKRGAKA